MRIPLGGRVAYEDARALSTGDSVTTLSMYLVSDIRGSLIAATGAGTPVTPAREAEFDAWGQKLTNFTALSSPRHGFDGAEADAAVGTYVFGARTYDPSLRRWVSPDPLFAGAPELGEVADGSLNLYAFADSNPATKTDVSGFCPVCAVVAGAAVILGMGASAPSDSKAAPPNIGGMMASIPGPSVVVAGAAKLAERGAAYVLEKGVPTAGQAARAFIQGTARAEQVAGKVETAAPAAEAVAPKAAEATAAARPQPLTPKPLDTPGGPKTGSAGGPGAGKRIAEGTKKVAEKEAGGDCVFCGKPTTRGPGPTQRNTDHAIPKSRDGNNTLANAQNSCRTCNLDKGARTTKEYLDVLQKRQQQGGN